MNYMKEVDRMFVFLRHITLRKRAGKALRETEERYKTILDNIEDGYYEVDLAGNFIFFNNSLCRELGYLPEEMIGMNNRQYMDKETAKKVYQAFNRVYTTGESYKAYDWGIIRKDGTKRIHESSVSLMRNAKGERIGFQGITRDITYRKQAEEAFRKSEEVAQRLAQENALVAEIGRVINSSPNIDEIFERFSQAVAKLVPCDRIVVNLCNPQKDTRFVRYVMGIDVPKRRVGEYVPLANTAVGEVVRTKSSLLLPPGDLKEEKEMLDRLPEVLPAFEAGIRSSIMVPLISENQTIGVLTIRSTKTKAYTEKDVRLVESIASQIAGAIANAQLYEERKLAEGALRESGEKFRDLYDNAPLGYHEYNAEGRITNVNQTDLEMLGYTAEEMIGQFMWNFNVEKEIAHEQILAKLAGTLPPGRNLERTYRKKDGTAFPVLIEDRLILDEKGQIKGIRCTIQDITERKKAEAEMAVLQEQLRQSQKMDAIGQLAAGIAHDFNNLLNIMGGYSQLALMDLKEGDRFSKSFKAIENATTKAANLVRQILAFSRRQVMEMIVVDLTILLAHPAAIPALLVFPIFRIANAGFGFDVIEPGVFHTFAVGPDVLAGYRTGVAPDAFIEVQHHGDLRTDFHSAASNFGATAKDSG